MNNQNFTILCLFTRLLGNKILSYRHLDALQKIPGLDVRYIFIDPQDFVKYPSNKFQRLSCALDVAAVAKKKYLEQCDFPYDILFINGFEISLGFRKEIQSHPTLLELDSTPHLAHQQLGRTSKGLIKKLRSCCANIIMSALFKRVFKHMNAFFTMTQWCADDLIKTYHVSPNIIFPTYCPADLQLWHPRDAGPENNHTTLLFVGNDFTRKGGEDLLRWYQTDFSNGRIKLQIVSKDQNLAKRDLPAGVEVYQNIPHEEIIRIFQNADIFIFPTKKEYLGVAATEACCVGLPVITRDVGGLKEFVIDGHNGYLMPYNSTDEQWIEKIRHLIDHPEERKKMGENSRKLAEEMFSLEKFEAKEKAIIEEIIGIMTYKG